MMPVIMGARITAPNALILGKINKIPPMIYTIAMSGISHPICIMAVNICMESSGMSSGTGM